MLQAFLVVLVVVLIVLVALGWYGITRGAKLFELQAQLRLVKPKEDALTARVGQMEEELKHARTHREAAERTTREMNSGHGAGASARGWPV